MTHYIVIRANRYINKVFECKLGKTKYVHIWFTSGTSKSIE